MAYSTVNYLTNLKLTEKYVSIFEITWTSLAHKISRQELLPRQDECTFSSL